MNDPFLEWLEEEYDRHAERLKGRGWNQYDDAYTDALDTARSMYEWMKKAGTL